MDFAGFWLLGTLKIDFSKSKPLIKNQPDRFFNHHLVSPAPKGELLTTNRQAYFLKKRCLKNACFEHSQSA